MPAPDLKPWLRAAHPLREPRGMLEARRAARLGAVGILASLISSLCLAAWMAANPATALALLGPEAQAMAGGEAGLMTVAPTALGLASLFLCLILGLLAAVQWTMTTRLIPFAALVLTGWGAATNVFLILTRGVEAEAAPFPVWLTLIDWTATTVLVLLSAAAARGAVRLHQLTKGT